MSKSVLVDTSFLIILANPQNEHYDAANRYFKYCLNPDHDIQLHLSTIVISEYHQRASAVDWLKTGNFITLPFNVRDAIEVSNIAHSLGSGARAARANEEGAGGRAEYKDDIKLIAQAHTNNLDFIITEDESTLAKYVELLRTAGILKVRAIVVSKGYDVSPFEGGQPTLPFIE